MTGNGGTTVHVAGRYRLERRIGRGGAGAVWRAHDTHLDRPVALKQIPIASEAETSSRERAMREARAAARLHVPNVVQVFDVIEEDSNVYLIMELVEAPNLNSLVRRKGPLAPADAATLGLQMLDALEAAHRAGIVHRDVKPSNVLMQGRAARLTDFGIARLSDDPTLTATGVVMGTPAYIAPEHAQGHEIGPAVDLYGLGATLYYAVEGTSPFRADGSLSTVMAVINKPPRAPTQAGPLHDLLLELLAKDPLARPGPDEIRERLRDVAGGRQRRRTARAPWVARAAASVEGTSADDAQIDRDTDEVGVPGDDTAEQPSPVARDGGAGQPGGGAGAAGAAAGAGAVAGAATGVAGAGASPAAPVDRAGTAAAAADHDEAAGTAAPDHAAADADADAGSAADADADAADADADAGSAADPGAGTGADTSATEDGAAAGDRVDAPADGAGADDADVAGDRDPAAAGHSVEAGDGDRDAAGAGGGGGAGGDDADVATVGGHASTAPDADDAANADRPAAMAAEAAPDGGAQRDDARSEPSAAGNGAVADAAEVAAGAGQARPDDRRTGQAPAAAATSANGDTPAAARAGGMGRRVRAPRHAPAGAATTVEDAAQRTGTQPAGRASGIPALTPERRRVAILAGLLAVLVVAAISLNAMFGGNDDGGAEDEDGAPAAAAGPVSSETAAPGTGADASPSPDAAPDPSPSPSPSETPEPEQDEDDAQDDEDAGDGVLPAADAEVPDDWVEFTSNSMPYTVRHPPGWKVTQLDSTRTDISDPNSSTYLRLDWVDAKRDPAGAWEEYEPSFAARHSGYRNLGITETTFRGDPAALWEYRYRDGGVVLHAYNLGVNQGDHGFGLNMQTRQGDWRAAQKLWAQFLSSYEFTG